MFTSRYVFSTSFDISATLNVVRTISAFTIVLYSSFAKIPDSVFNSPISLGATLISLNARPGTNLSGT